MKIDNCWVCYRCIEEHNETYFIHDNDRVMCEMCMSGFEKKQYKKDFTGISIELLTNVLEILKNCETSYDADDKVAEALKLLKEMKENEDDEKL